LGRPARNGIATMQKNHGQVHDVAWHMMLN
jgi:hypothetical protein